MERDTDNLFASIPGNDPVLGSEAVLFGAHIDHLGVDPVTGEVFPGADDNASGVSVVMELARALAAGIIQPKRRIILAAFNAEELGLIGSCQYASAPTHPLATTRAMFSIDMVGEGDGTGVTINGALNKPSKWLADLMRSSAQELGYDGNVLFGGPIDASDHVCFAQVGISSVMVSSNGAHPTYHTPQDTAAGIKAGNLKGSAELTWSVLVPLALGKDPIFAWSGRPGAEAPQARRSLGAAWLPSQVRGSRNRAFPRASR